MLSDWSWPDELFLCVSQVTLGPMSTWVWSLCTRSFWENTTDWLKSFTSSILTGARTRCTRRPERYWAQSTRWEDKTWKIVRKGYFIYACLLTCWILFGRSWHGITTCPASWAAVLTWPSYPRTKVTTPRLTPASPTFSPPLPFGLHMWPCIRLWTASDLITGWALSTWLCRYTTLCLHPGESCKRVCFTHTHACTHARTHARTLSHTHTYTHTHTQTATHTVHSVSHTARSRRLEGKLHDQPPTAEKHTLLHHFTHKTPHICQTARFESIGSVRVQFIMQTCMIVQTYTGITQ